MSDTQKFCQLWLTCGDTIEADTIAQTLLDKHLIACAKQTPVNSNFLWKGTKEHNEEVLLVMDSRLDLFENIEKEISKLHSYEAFVLQAVPIVKVSKSATEWLNKTMDKDNA